MISRFLQSKWAIVALLSVILLAYLPVVFLGFVWDDFPLIVQNDQIQSFDHLGAWFVSDLWADVGDEGFRSGFYRPLVLLSFGVDYMLWGESAAGFHLQSVAWHLLSVWLVYRIVSDCYSIETALVAAAVFGLHPAMSEGVVWIAARNDPMGAALLLGALYSVFPSKCSRVRTALGAMLFFGALCSKESSVVGLLFLPLLDWGRGTKRESWSVYLAFLFSLIVWAVMRWSADIAVQDLEFGTGFEWVTGEFDQILSNYVRLFFWPFDLSVGRSVEYLRDPGWMVVSGLLLGGCFTGFLLICGRRIAAAGLAIFVLSFAPAVLAIAANAQLGERYLYLPMFGLVLAIGAVVERFSRQKVLFFFVVVVGFWGVQRRIPDWHSDVSMWEAAVKTDPSPYTWGSLGHAYNRRAEIEASTGEAGSMEVSGENSDVAQAMAYFEKSFSDSLPYLDNCLVLVRTPMKKWKFKRALRNARVGRDAGCEEHPQHGGQFAGIYGSLLALNGYWGEARRYLPEAQRDPNGRGAILQAVLMIRDWRLSESPVSELAYCALRETQGPAVAGFDQDVYRLLNVVGITTDGLFSSKGSATLICSQTAEVE